MALPPRALPPPGPAPHVNPAFFPPAGPPPTAYPGLAPAPAHGLSEAEFEEIMSRNRTVSSSAINRAVQDASCNEYGSAIETLVTAISLIKQSKVANDDRCRILISSLQDTLHGIENKSYAARRERSRSRERERGYRRHYSREREREYRDHREREYYHRERSRSRERDYRSREAKYYEESERYKERERRINEGRMRLEDMERDRIEAGRMRTEDTRERGGGEPPRDKDRERERRH